MQTFTIGELAHLSGVKAHTIRVWEQRYGLLAPQRNEGRQRLYTNEDLKKLLRIAYLVSLGHRISALARLPSAEVVALALDAPAPSSQESLVNQLVEAMIDYDTDRFDKILHHSILHLGIERAVLTVIYPFFNKTGKLWLTDHILPANEHFASHLIRRKMIVAIDGLEKSPSSVPQVLLFAPEGEHHELPLLLADYLLKKNGKSTVYMGTNVPTKALEEYLSEKTLPYLQVNIFTRMPDQSADQYITELLNRFPTQRIVFSGPLAYNVTFSHPRLLLIKSLDEYYKWLADLT